ncbi:MAG TPA: thioredoxin domain-containing protein [Pyrinomonadaceae bacterium]|nr:thioredoxin domain-containing protein [Pyrinomonadaceae bacterium]
MKYRNLIYALLFGLSFPASTVLAQRTRQGTTPQQPTTRTTTPAKPTATPQTAQRQTATAPAPGTLATVDGQAITLADLDPQVRQVVEDFDKKMPELRKDALDARISTLLIESEAQKRKVTIDQLIDAEVNNMVKDPTDAEIQAVYDANRQKIGNADLATVRPQIIAYLRNQQAQKLSDDLVQRLRQTHTVTMGTVDVNSPNLQSSAVLATVDGKPITVSDFNERLKPFVYKLQHEIYDGEMHALDMKINEMLLDAEAKRQNKTPEDIYKTEVGGKTHDPTDAEITKFYNDNKARIPGDLASVRNDISDLLKSQQLNRLEAEFAQRLRSGANVQIFLKEPQPPVLAISTADSPARGDVSAPVTMVEFTDFQCSACAAMYPVIEDAMKTYGNRVRLVVRNFPLSMHPNARKAAEAASAANAQGKFFEYIAILFKNQTALDNASLKKYASDLGLDRSRFDSALDSGQYAARVSHDVEEGEAYGVEATPTIFINGVMLRNMTPEGLRAAIESALAAKTPQRNASR